MSIYIVAKSQLSRAVSAEVGASSARKGFTKGNGYITTMKPMSA